MLASSYLSWLRDGRPEDLESALAPLLPALMARARRLLPHATDADDAVQEAVIELLRTRATLSPAVPLAAIVQRLVWERSLMQGRSRTRRRIHEQPLRDQACATTARGADSSWGAPLPAGLSPTEELMCALIEEGGDPWVRAEQPDALGSRFALRLRRRRARKRSR